LLSKKHQHHASALSKKHQHHASALSKNIDTMLQRYPKTLTPCFSAIQNIDTVPQRYPEIDAMLSSITKHNVSTRTPYHTHFFL
jgi:hypothetical protein